MNFEKQIMNELSSRGLNVRIKQIETIKNAVKCQGIRIINSKNQEVTPIVYYSSGETIAVIADRIINVISHNNFPRINISDLCDYDYVASHLILAVSRRDGEAEKVFNKHYLNFDLIMKLKFSDESTGDIITIKVVSDILNFCKMSEDEAWKYAAENSAATSQIRNMSDIIDVGDGRDGQLYIASCNNGYDGASVMYFPSLFEKFCMEHQFNCLIILPSSTQEVIIIPDYEALSTQEMIALVSEVNDSVVDPLVQMEPAVYRYQLGSNAVSVLLSL